MVYSPLSFLIQLEKLLRSNKNITVFLLLMKWLASFVNKESTFSLTFFQRDSKTRYKKATQGSHLPTKTIMQFKNINYCFTDDTFLKGKRVWKWFKKEVTHLTQKKIAKLKNITVDQLPSCSVSQKYILIIYVHIWLIFFVKNHYDFWKGPCSIFSYSYDPKNERDSW